MKTALVCLAVVAVVGALPVRVKRGHVELEEHGHGHGHGHATSYQNFNLESYHPVPVYKKHEPVHHISSDHGHLGAAAALSLGGHEEHEGYASLGESAYHRAALADDGAEHGEEAYAHLGAAAVSEDAEEGYEGHGSY